MAFEFLRGYIENSDTKKDIKKLEKEVAKINAFTDAVAKLSDTELQAKTDEFKARLANGETLDQLLPEAYAVVREASTRVLGMRHFDVQLMGGVILHQGRIAEMKTGEGKTLVATLPVYLNALTGKGVHVITVNDYLATRDSEQMGKLYNFLGLSVGLIVHGLDFNQRKEAYAADITYGTNNEFGFDYLRDNMVMHPQNMVQRELNFALVDEVDSILIDEARTPLIISGVAEKPKDYYTMVSKIIPRLKAEQDYTVDEKAKNVVLTEEGVTHVEQLLGINNLSDESNMELAHHVHVVAEFPMLSEEGNPMLVTAPLASVERRCSLVPVKANGALVELVFLEIVLGDIDECPGVPILEGDVQELIRILQHIRVNLEIRNGHLTEPVTPPNILCDGKRFPGSRRSGHEIYCHGLTAFTAK